MKTRRDALSCLSVAAASLACPALGRAAGAAPLRSLDDPLRLAADVALVDSGFAGHLQRAFARDTGVALQLLRSPVTTLLSALERGEHDVALANAPSLELALEKQGLAHDRRPVATTDCVLVGPLALLKPLDAGTDAALAITRLAQAQAAFISAADGSGTHLVEQALWRTAQLAPAAPWYRAAARGSSLLAQARDAQACAWVERGVWTAEAAGKGYGVLVAGDPRLALPVHVLRSFHTRHPGARLFVNWVTGGAGERIAASVRGYRAPAR